jgi:hypothetical protein
VYDFGYMRPQAILENLGYPSLQVKIYLGLLKIGEGTVSDIARQSLPQFLKDPSRF